MHRTAADERRARTKVLNLRGSPFGRNGLSHQLQLHGDADPAGVHQPDDAAVGEVHAPAHVVEAELGVRGCDPDVAG